MTMPVAIIGAGGWGTALAATLARADRQVSLWVYEADLAEGMPESREIRSTFRPFEFRNRSTSAIP